MIVGDLTSSIERTSGDTNMTITKVGITGAAGDIGTTLREGLSERYHLVPFDLKEIEGDPNGSPSRIVDLSDPNAVQGEFSGLDVVIHLAADRDPDASWEQVLRHNITATYNVFHEAVRAGVRKIVFATTNHTQHGYTMGQSTDSLNLGFYDEKRLLTLNDPSYPDSLYAVSKLFGENLGRYYATTANLQFVGLRIGWLVPEDDASVKQGTVSEDYLRAMFLSKRDCVEAFTRAIEADAPYILAYAISRNDRRIFDLEVTEKVLGFHPQDNAESYFQTR
jgi:nucleoside-diphosphate-sugar epimerase